MTAQKRPADAIFEACAALVAGAIDLDGERNFLKARGLHPATATVLKAAVSPATVDSSSWAGTLAGEAVVDFLALLAPLSASAALIARGLGLEFPPGVSKINAPVLTPQAFAGAFVGEGMPGRAVQFAVQGPELARKKMLLLGALSREMAMTSNAERLVRAALIESAALTLDAYLFSTAAEDADRPAGLLNGLSSLGASTAGGLSAQREDLTTLAEVVVPIAGGDIVFIADPMTAFRMSLQTEAPMPYPFLPSAALAEGTVIAVAPRALAFSVDPVPKIEVSSTAGIHMSTDPQQISAPGSPNTVAAPVFSAFQLAMIAIRLILNAGWTKRHSNAVAYITDADWATSEG